MAYRGGDGAAERNGYAIAAAGLTIITNEAHSTAPFIYNAGVKRAARRKLEQELGIKPEVRRN